MKILISYCLLFSALLFTNCYANSIKKNNVFLVTKGQERYIQISESNIRSAASDTFQITDSVSLSRIESSINKLEKISFQHNIGGIYMLCEITYANGNKEVLSFEDRNNGYIKWGLIIYSNLKGIEGMILFSKPNLIQ